MAESDSFLQLAGLELIRREGVRVVKAPPTRDGGEVWLPGWDDWDEVLAGEGPGVQPSIFAFRRETDTDPQAVRALLESVVARVAGGQISNPNQPALGSVRITAIFCYDSIDPSQGRKLARIVPSRFYQGIKPAVWIVDLASGRMWAPKTFGVIASQAQSGVRHALEQTVQGNAGVGAHELAHAEASAVAQREVFVSTLRSNIPYVTYTLIALNCIVFAFETFYPGGNMANATLLRFGALQPRLVNQGEWWRLFTAMFVHIGPVHILFNMIALYSIGTLVERIYGALRYSIIYFASGLFASMASYAYFVVISKQMYEIAAGASGAIFGIAGVVIVLGVIRHSVVPRAVALQLSVFMGILIVMNLAFDYVSPGIDIRAHIGGLLVGLILGYVMAPRMPSSGTGELQVHGGAGSG